MRQNNLKDITETVNETRNRFVKLHNVNIKIAFIPMSLATMNCRPTIKSFLFPWKKREYVVSVNSREDFSQYTIPISALGKTALMGWFGHELSHILQYERMGFRELIKFPFKYFLDLSFRKNFEVECTKIAREIGFSDEFNEVEKFLRNDQRVHKKYRYRFERLYISESNKL